MAQALKRKSLKMHKAGLKAAATRRRNQEITGFRKNKAGKSHPITARSGNKVGKIKPGGSRLKVGPKWAQNVPIKEGALKQYGYQLAAGSKDRHGSLVKAINAEGYEVIRKRMQFLVNVSKSNLKRVYSQDLSFVEGMKAERVKRYKDLFFRLSKKPKDRTVLKVVPSESRAGVKYYITEGTRGGLSCTCPAFIFPKRGGARTCKHIERYLAS